VEVHVFLHDSGKQTDKPGVSAQTQVFPSEEGNAILLPWLGSVSITPASQLSNNQ